MRGCSASAASMTGSSELGPIQAQQDSLPVLDDGLFSNGRFLARPESKRRMPNPSARPVQLTPLWEYVVRTRKFPEDVEASSIFEEIGERLRDPEWQVRQHALRVLVDVLPTFGPDAIDGVAGLVLPELIDNLGHPAPAVRKGSLDVLRIYLLHSPSRDNVTLKILHEGMNRADALDAYQTNVATGVILSAPLLLFPSRSSLRPGDEVVRQAAQALALRLVQLTHQESALRSLAKIRDAVGPARFRDYLHQLDPSINDNFELLCDVYNVETARESAAGRRPTRTRAAYEKLRRRDSVEDSIKDVVAIDKSWESEDDSDTSGIADEDDDARTNSGSISSARVLLETEIKFNEETAITMTILEEQQRDRPDPRLLHSAAADDGFAPDDRRKTPRRVHFGGEIVKLRTPDSEDAESVVSVAPQAVAALARTRIPLPVSPATRMPRRPRSSSQPNLASMKWQRPKRPRRSASSSPRREPHTHQANLSPKKSILAKSSEHVPSYKLVETEEAKPKARMSRRDSVTPLSSPRIVIEDMDDDGPSFRVCEEPDSNRVQQGDESIDRARTPSPILLGDVCEIPDTRSPDMDSVFGDKSGIEIHEKSKKDFENAIRSAYRSRSASDNSSRFSFSDEREGSGRDRRRSSSAKMAGFDVFPRQERNYILMELSSPTKDLSRRSSIESNPPVESPKVESFGTGEDSESVKESNEEKSSASVEGTVQMTDEAEIDSNKMAESEIVEETKFVSGLGDSVENEAELDIIEDDAEKSALDAKERSSDSSSDSDWKNNELSWEELGLVDDEVLADFHNKDEWRARVRGLERIASAMRTPSALEAVEERLGSLLHALLGGERNCRVAAAALAAATVVLNGVSIEAVNNRMSLIAWGLVRQGGPNANNLARLVMLRTSPGLFVEKLLQPQCVGARNAKMRENTLQLLIFSLVTFPSTEFKVKTAIDKVVAIVGDRRKRVRLAALETLAVISQIYESEDILEASKNFYKGKQDGQTIQTAIKTRLARKMLPTVSVDGLVVYGLQISSNSQHSGADVEWIVAGSGSVSPGTARSRGQLIAMSKMENNANEENDTTKKLRTRPASEHGTATGTADRLLEKSERTSSWKLLPQSEQDDRTRRKIERTSKSADFSKVNNPEIEYHYEGIVEKYSKPQKPYSTPKRTERKSDRHPLNESKPREIVKSNEYPNRLRPSSSEPSLKEESLKQESRIPIYQGRRHSEMYAENHEMISHRDNRQLEYGEQNDYLAMYRKKHHTVRSAAPRTNYHISREHSNGFKNSKLDKFFDDMDAELQAKFEEVYSKRSAQEGLKRYHQRALSYEKLNKGLETLNHARGDMGSVPHYQYSSEVTETYESIYKKQQRARDEKQMRMYETALNPLVYGYGYENYVNKRIQVKTDKRTKQVQTDERSSLKRRLFVSPFDIHIFGEPIAHIIDKETGRKADAQTDGSGAGDSARTRSATSSSSKITPAEQPRHDAGETRSSGSSRTPPPPPTPPPPAHTESDESAPSDGNEPACTRSFDVISVKSNASRRLTPEISMPISVEEPTTSGSEGEPVNLGDDRPKSAISSTSCSLAKPSSTRRNNSLESLLAPSRASARTTHSTVDLDEVGGSSDADRVETSESPEEEEAAFETLDFRNGPRQVILSARSRASREYDNDTTDTTIPESNGTPHKCNNSAVARKTPSPMRFVSEEPRDDSDETPPLPIGFDGCSETDETDDIKPQSRMQTPIDVPKRLCKVSPCKMRPQANCHRSSSVPASRHNEKTSKAVQQCFAQLESKDWEITLRGLRKLSQIATEEPEQLDFCAPGLLARLLGNQIKNLRSQVARVACTAAADVFSAHVRGIDQDLDEMAGPLLHRTADTNRFLREDCNVALDSMVEHFPPHRTIMTIANRGASHQNTIVHATTARLLYMIVDEIGPEQAMSLQRDIRDKLFLTTAKLLTDGNLQARKHAKQIFRLLLPCEGFRKALTDAVPETMLRLIDKTLRTL